MNPLLVLFIILGGVVLWFLLAFAYKLIGATVLNTVREAMNALQDKSLDDLSEDEELEIDESFYILFANYNLNQYPNKYEPIGLFKTYSDMKDNLRRMVDINKEYVDFSGLEFASVRFNKKEISFFFVGELNGDI